MEVFVDVMNDEMGLSCLMGVKRQSRALTTHMTVYSKSRLNLRRLPVVQIVGTVERGGGRIQT